jgi:hypothetical protein
LEQARVSCLQRTKLACLASVNGANGGQVRLRGSLGRLQSGQLTRLVRVHGANGVQVRLGGCLRGSLGSLQSGQLTRLVRVHGSDGGQVRLLCCLGSQDAGQGGLQGQQLAAQPHVHLHLSLV